MNICSYCFECHDVVCNYHMCSHCCKRQHWLIKGHCQQWNHFIIRLIKWFFGY